MWLLSYMFAMEFIWNNDGKHIRLFFVWAMPVAIIAHEFSQLMGLASGTWDILDLTSYSIAIIIYSCTKLLQKSGIRKNEVIELIYRGFI